MWKIIVDKFIIQWFPSWLCSVSSSVYFVSLFCLPDVSIPHALILEHVNQMTLNPNRCCPNMGLWQTETLYPYICFLSMRWAAGPYYTSPHIMECLTTWTRWRLVNHGQHFLKFDCGSKQTINLCWQYCILFCNIIKSSQNTFDF